MSKSQTNISSKQEDSDDQVIVHDLKINIQFAENI